jgi:hypothetical protein
MEKTELSPAELTDRVIWLQATVEQLQERERALQLVLSWLLARQPNDEAMAFLSSQANEFDGARRLEEDVALLDELREDVAQWHAQWHSGHTPQRS